MGDSLTEESLEKVYGKKVDGSFYTATIYTDSFTGRKCAVGSTVTGSRFELVEYGDSVHVYIEPFRPFFESCSIVEMVTRLTSPVVAS
jgi:hypothetical protein